MTNEQTAVMLGGYLSELEIAISECDIVNDGEKDLRYLEDRLRKDIAALKGEAQPVFGGGRP